ncbi:hypothetical protein BH10BDE1_BH10BDE1_18110 [soil metagenome]
MAQFLGLYQLENLHRAQTKFMLVAVTDNSASIPPHPLLKPDLVLEATEGPSRIEARMLEQNYPAWWPIVVISKDGADEAEVVQLLEATGLINVYSYRGGWDALVGGT